MSSYHFKLQTQLSSCSFNLRKASSQSDLVTFVLLRVQTRYTMFWNDCDRFFEQHCLEVVQTLFIFCLSKYDQKTKKVLFFLFSPSRARCPLSYALTIIIKPIPTIGLLCPVCRLCNNTSIHLTPSSMCMSVNHPRK